MTEKFPWDVGGNRTREGPVEIAVKKLRRGEYRGSFEEFFYKGEQRNGAVTGEV